MNRGFLMFAAGNKKYGKMAAALAATIKVRENIPIALLWHGSVIKTLSEAELKLFDQLIELDDKYVYNKDGTFNPIKARLYFYELTPFDETLAIDVDNVWLKKKPSEVFDELAEHNFSIQNVGHTTTGDQYYSVWAKIDEVINAYGIDGKRFYRTYGEWIYWKRSAEAKKVFSAAKKIFNTKPKANVKAFIGQAITDELSFSIAIAQTEVHPHKEKYLPTTYFDVTSKGFHRYDAPYKLAEKYYTISMGGSTNPPTMISNYNIVAGSAYRKLGLKNPFHWEQKRTFLKERKIA